MKSQFLLISLLGISACAPAQMEEISVLESTPTPFQPIPVRINNPVNIRINEPVLDPVRHPWAERLEELDPSIDWDCSISSFEGRQYWTGFLVFLVACDQNDISWGIDCIVGINVHNSGQNDTCMSP